jgi:hypothetical protein
MKKLSISVLCAVVGGAFVLGQASAATITAWNFDSNYPDNPPPAVPPYIIHPLPSTGSGTATPLGMNNGYTYTFADGGTTVGANDGEDLINTPGSSTNLATDNAWRVRGTSNKEGQGPGTGNGWNTAAPQYTQGAQFSASTAGFQNIVFKYDWFSTNQAVSTMQAQYTTDGTTWTNVSTSASAGGAYGQLMVASPNNFTNGIMINFAALGITAVNNDPNFGVRLVSAYDPTYAGPGAPTYTGASGGVYNNNSGNWRFDNISVSGLVPEPAGFVMGSLGLVGLLFYGWRRQRAA